MQNVYGDTNAIFRTADLRAIGGYETDPGTPFEDWETFVKIANAGHGIDVIPDPLFYYRLRHDNRSFVMTKSYTDIYPFVHRLVGKMFAAPGSIDESDAAAIWHCVAGLEVQTRLRHRLETQVQELRHRLESVQVIEDKTRQQHTIIEEQRILIEELSVRQRFLRYRTADKCVRILKRIPLAHGSARRSVHVAWKGWKNVAALRLVKAISRRLKAG